MKGPTMVYEQIVYTEADGVATVAINRPEVYNAFSGQTLEELIHVFKRADAFSFRSSRGTYRGRRQGVLHRRRPIVEGWGLQRTRRDRPADRRVPQRDPRLQQTGHRSCERVRDRWRQRARDPVRHGYRVGHREFGQVGPHVGSVDAGFGTALLARVVGEKKAREMWYLCRRYTAAQALDMGLVNAVVPADQLDAEVAAWCAEIVDKSPTAIAFAKRSFNIDTEMIRGVSSFALQGLALYYDTEESKEGGNTFREKRKPDFSPYVR